MERKGFIGGSDLYSIMRGDWHDLWLVKTGRKEPDDLSGQFNVQLGNETESFNMTWLNQQTGWCRYFAEVTRKNIADVPYQARPDGIGKHDHSDEYAIIEAKHTGGHKKMSDILSAYLPQVHLYMRVMDIHQTVFTVIFGNRWEHCVVDYDHEFWMKVHAQAFNFWQHVVEDTRPDTYEEVKIDWTQVKVDGLVSRDASQDNQFVNLAHEFVNASQNMRQHDSIKKELRSMINDNEREVFCDLLTIKRDKRGACRITINEGAV
jgi:sulfite reductase alpha subunit-like flavoprotein